MLGDTFDAELDEADAGRRRDAALRDEDGEGEVGGGGMREVRLGLGVCIDERDVDALELLLLPNDAVKSAAGRLVLEGELTPP